MNSYRHTSLAPSSGTWVSFQTCSGGGMFSPMQSGSQGPCVEVIVCVPYVCGGGPAPALTTGVSDFRRRRQLPPTAANFCRRWPWREAPRLNAHVCVFRTCERSGWLCPCWQPVKQQTTHDLYGYVRLCARSLYLAP